MGKIPKRNYLILSVILIVTFGLLYYFYLWYSAYASNAALGSVMDEYTRVINYNEIDSYILENKEVYIYASYLNNNEIRKFELTFRNNIVKNDLQEKILYLDLTNELDSNSKLKYNLSKNNLPSILIFNDGTLVDSYDIKKSGYSSEKVMGYLLSKDAMEK